MIYESFEVVCDGDDCFESTSSHGDEHTALTFAKKDGWSIEDNSHLCPSCKEATK